MSDVGSTAEEPMVCLTLRWRKMDSNFQYAGAVNRVIAPFVQPRRRAARTQARVAAMPATCSCYRVGPMLRRSAPGARG
jgi:hypothetical protein